jgi:hypothetical protein
MGNMTDEGCYEEEDEVLGVGIGVENIDPGKGSGSGGPILVCIYTYKNF